MNDYYKKLLEDFLSKKTKKDKIVVIYWPTWAWKTDLSIEVAKFLDTQIISTDSRQIFKYMDIWTGKIKEEEKRWVEHHMIDIIEPNTNYSVWEFKKESWKIISNLQTLWKIPILCWWTGLYIDSLIYDFSIPKIPADLNLRKSLEKEALENWKEYVYKKLEKIDSKYAKTIHYNNLQYVIRAIEIKTISWKSKLDYKIEKKLKYDVLFLTPYYFMNREELYNRVDKRVLKMINEWLLDEVKRLLSMWYKKSDFWMKSIWYSELLDYIYNEIDLEDAISLIQKNTRNYAKRQLTWFRKYEQNQLNNFTEIPK